MVKVKGILATLLCVGALMACNSGAQKSVNEDAPKKQESAKTETVSKSVKGKWAEADRKEFLQGCLMSALQSYAGRNQKADTAVVINICTCLGKSLEEQYSYDDANKLSREEVKEKTMEAAKNCN